jgi:hypothetical protein
VTHQAERRTYQRYALTCPIVICDMQGNELLRTQTVNISDGGAFLAMPAPVDVTSAKTTPGQQVRAEVRLPRSTTNSYLLERIDSPARVIRQGATGLAIMFIEPLQLHLDE